MGIGIGGKGSSAPWFVVGKDLEQNRLLVAQGKDHPLLYSTGCWVEQVSWSARRRRMDLAWLSCDTGRQTSRSMWKRLAAGCG